jgi:hypothetical protein
LYNHYFRSAASIVDGEQQYFSTTKKVQQPVFKGKKINGHAVID